MDESVTDRTTLVTLKVLYDARLADCTHTYVHVDEEEINTK